MSKKILIVGTSQELDKLEENTNISKILEQQFIIYCINTSYIYFKNIDSLFLNGHRFKNFTDKDLNEGRYIGSIFTTTELPNIHNIKVRQLHLENMYKYNNYININIKKPLPHGPTTLLDIVFPVCCYFNHKQIYLFGLNYPKRAKDYIRFKKDKNLVNRNDSWDKQTELNYAHKKLLLWKEYFEQHNIDCFDLSEQSETPFIKKSLTSEILRD